MVTLTFFSMDFQTPENSDLYAVDEVIDRDLRDGGHAYYFTLSDVYGSTMFGFDRPREGGDGTLFSGNATVEHNGKAGFLPLYEYHGQVNGVAVDQFAADYVRSHGTNVGLTEALMAGDDVIEAAGAFGTGQAALAFGWGGDDFIYMTHGYTNATGGEGRDTFYFDGVVPNQYPYSQINDLTKGDEVQLSADFFTSLGEGFSKANYVLGTAAKDSDDYLIFNGRTFDDDGVKSFSGVLLYDPDGNGSEKAISVSQIQGVGKTLKFSAFDISDRVPSGNEAHPAVAPDEGHGLGGSHLFHPVTHLGDLPSLALA